MDIAKMREKILELDRKIASLDREISEAIVRRNKFAAERKQVMNDIVDMSQPKMFADER